MSVANPQRVLAELTAETGPLPPLPAHDIALLAEQATDPAQLKRWLKRHAAGEPLAHITGVLRFRELELHIDKRAYVTDPELTHLVDAVIAAAEGFTRTYGRPPLIAEIGIGCGSLALSIKQHLPAVTLVGLDIDPDPLAVAAANAERLGLDVRLVESDLFDSWPEDLPPPDLVYSDPPWGDDDTLYDPERGSIHYHAMPPISAYPLGGPTALHELILRSLAQRAWSTEVWLNGGVLPRPRLEALGELAPRRAIHTPAAGLSLLQCGFGAAADRVE